MNKEIKLVKLLKNRYFNEEIENHNTKKLIINSTIKGDVKDNNKEFTSILKKFYEKHNSINSFNIHNELINLYTELSHINLTR